MDPVALTPWQPAPPSFALPRTSIHLWRFRLDLPDDDLASLETLLSASERTRAARLLDPAKAASFVVARGRMRQLLALYLAVPAATLRFSYGEHGKPSLAETDVAFNLSHAGAWGLLAIRFEGAVGVDVETIDPRLDYAQIAPRYFSEAETGCLMRFPVARRRRAFYRVWTRKEALLKGIGSGFSGSRERKPDPTWTLRSLVVDHNHLAALAFDGEATLVERWSLGEGETAQSAGRSSG